MAEQPRWQALGFPDQASYEASGAADWDAKIPPTGQDAAARKLRAKDEKKAQKTVSLAATRQEGWLNLCQRSDSGLRTNEFNAGVMLQEAPEFRDAIFWNARRLGPESALDTPAGPPGPWSDGKTAAAILWAQGAGLQLKPKTFETALLGVSQRNPIDPLRDYLDGLVWDETERLKDWLAIYCGAEDSVVNSLIGSKFLIGAVARALKPGCRMDYMLIFEGPQGRKKSTAVKILGGEWTAENLPDLHSKDAQQAAGGFWFLEISELSALKKSDVEQSKSFLTRTADSYRPPYGRHFVTVPRWCVCIGNVNPDGNPYLKDHTGNRRYWPVAVGHIDTAALALDRDQLFAEAVSCYRAGDHWWPDNDEQEEMLANIQEEREHTDEWQEVIGDWIGSKTGLDTLTGVEIATGALRLDEKEINVSVQMRVAICMKKLGYLKLKQMINGIRKWRYVKSQE